MIIVNWNAVLTWVPLVAILVTIVGMWLENRRSRVLSSVDLFLRTEQQFRHDKDMIDTRQKAASALLEGLVTPEVYDVLNYFELVGELLRKRVFDPEMAWNSFYFRATGYWFASEKYLQAVRMDDPTIYGSYAYLVDILLDIERKKTKRLASALVAGIDVQEFLLEECRSFRYDVNEKVGLKADATTPADRLNTMSPVPENDLQIDKPDQYSMNNAIIPTVSPDFVVDDHIIVILHQGIDGKEDPTIVNACRVRDKLHESLSQLGYSPRTIFLDDAMQWVQLVRSVNPMLVFNVADLGFNYNNAFEPNVPAVLDGIGVRYTGSESYCMFFTSDKYASKQYLSALGVPVPRCWLYGRDHYAAQFPAIVKYRRLHNSAGVSFHSVVSTLADLEQSVVEMKMSDMYNDIIIEEYIEGIEVCAGFIGNGVQRRVLPVAEFSFGEYFAEKPKIRSFSGKWNKTSAEYSQVTVHQSQLPPSVIGKIDEITLKIASVFDIRDYGRFDYRLKEDGGDLTPFLVDINANPDVNDDATFFLMAQYDGNSYVQFVKSIVDAALSR